MLNGLIPHFFSASSADRAPEGTVSSPTFVSSEAVLPGAAESGRIQVIAEMIRMQKECLVNVMKNLHP
jgi:hypothetical protein